MSRPRRVDIGALRKAGQTFRVNVSCHLTCTDLKKSGRVAKAANAVPSWLYQAQLASVEMSSR